MRTVLLLLLLTGTAAAQDTTRIIPVDTVAITITRGTSTLAHVPAAVSIVPRDHIQNGRLTLGLDEPLAEVPGVLVFNRNNFAQGVRVTVRGFGARAAFGVRGVRIIEDGIPLTMADGQSTLNNVSLESTDRIEVLRGASSLLHGNAAGGVIELHTERPAPGFNVLAGGIAGDLGRGGPDNLRKFVLKAGGGSESTRYLVSGAQTNTNGFREHSHFEQTNINALLEHTSTNGARTTVIVNGVNSPRAEDPGALPADSARVRPEAAWPRNVALGAGKSGRQLQAGLQHERRVAGATLEAMLYGVTRSLDNPLTFAWITLHRRASGMRTTLSWPHVTLGVDGDLQRDARREFTNTDAQPGSTTRDQVDRVSTIGPFVRLSTDLTTRLSASGGVRYDRAHFSVADYFLTDGHDDSGRRTMSSVSPALGMTYGAGRNTTVFGSVSTSFQTPTTTELINHPPANGQPCCVAGFNSLNPEHAVSLELGVRGIAGAVAFDGAIYQTQIRDEIVPYQVAGAEGRNFFRNAGRTRHRGIELATSARVTPALRVTASYTWSRFVFLDDGIDAAHNEGNLLPGVPRHHLVARLQATVGAVIAEPEVEWTSSYYSNDANTPDSRNGAYTVSTLRLRPKHAWAGGVSPFAAINNLFDVRYNGSVVINAAGGRYFEPAPGRNFYLGLSLQTARNALTP